MLERLAQVGIYGWAHLVQVAIVLGILGVCVVYVIPRCARDIDEMWEELTKGKASSVTSREASEKQSITSSLPRDTGSVKEG